MDLVPKSELVSRLRRIQDWMRGADVGAIFVLQNADLFYFSGTVQSGLLCLPPEGDPIFLIQKSLSRGRAESPWERILPLPGFRKLPDILAAEGIRDRGSIGLELDVLPANLYLRLRDLFPGSRFVDASDAVRRTRMIKSPYEVGQIRSAAKMLERAFSEIPGWMNPGVTELAISARLEGFLRAEGHQGITRMRGFNYEIGYGTVSSGPSAAYPTCFPGPVGFVGLYPGVPNGGSGRKLADHDPLMADICGGFGGYIADETRTFVRGRLPADMVRAHDFTLELMREIESMLRPGTPCSEIYRHAIERVRESPYAELFMGVGDSRVRFVGHGVGLELDELPVLAEGFEMPLEPGMTIAVEPKIFFPERGGVGIEDTYLITEDGCEKLTAGPEAVIEVP